MQPTKFTQLPSTASRVDLKVKRIDVAEGGTLEGNANAFLSEAGGETRTLVDVRFEDRNHAMWLFYTEYTRDTGPNQHAW